MKTLLVPFGFLLITVVLWAMVVPVIRRRAHLMSTWNVFLFGFCNFVGVSAVQTGLAEEHMYGTFYADDYGRFMLGAAVFLATALLTHRYFQFPARLAQHRFQKWMQPNSAGLIFMGFAGALITLGTLATPQVQLVGQFLHAAGINGSIFATMFVFSAWYRQKINLPLLILTAVTFAAALGFLLATTFSRRDYVNIALVLPIGAYWAFYRYRHPTRMLVPLAAVATLGVFLLTAVSTLRVMTRDKNVDKVGGAIQDIQRLPTLAIGPGKAEGLIGGDTTEASLVAIQRYTHDADPEPFFSMIYVAQSWIPRAWFPDKVGSLGEILPRETGYVASHGYINWGPGIVGHGYHEGGPHMLVFYAVLLAAGCRFFDELLDRQHGNVFLWAIFASVSGQIFALSRGELGLMIVIILGGTITGLILNAIGRRIFGTVDYRYAGPAPADQSAAAGTSDGGVWADAARGNGSQIA